MRHKRRGWSWYGSRDRRRESVPYVIAWAVLDIVELGLPVRAKGQAAACTPRAAGQAAANLVYIRTIIQAVNKGSNANPLGMDKYEEVCYKRRL